MGNNFNSKENLNNEAERNEELARYLEQLPSFQARPQFQTDLRMHLLTQAVQIQTTSTRRQSFFTTKRLAMLIVACVLVVSAIVVAIAVTHDTPEADAYSRVYDPESQSYLNPNQAQQTLGFSIYVPSQIPSGYKVESASLGSDLFQEANNTAGAAASAQRTLQLSLVAKNGAQNDQIEIYEVHIPFHFDILQKTLNVQGAQSYDNVDIQGQHGYLIRGTSWRMVFLGAASNRRPTSTNFPNRPTTSGNPQRIRQAPFGFGRVQQFDPHNPQYFLQFQPLQHWTNGAATLIWERNNVLTIIVTNPNTMQNQLQQLASSFHELSVSN